MNARAQLLATEPSQLKPYSDNVLVELEPAHQRTTSSGVVVVKNKHRANETRIGRVLAVGPGHHGRPSWKHPEGAFIPTTVEAGQRVLVDANAGDDWSWELSSPRHNPKGAEFRATGERCGDYRCVRESEILAVVEDGASLE